MFFFCNLSQESQDFNFYDKIWEKTKCAIFASDLLAIKSADLNQNVVLHALIL